MRIEAEQRDSGATCWYECEKCGEVVDPVDVTYSAKIGGNPRPTPEVQPGVHLVGGTVGFDGRLWGGRECGPVVVKSG